MEIMPLKSYRTPAYPHKNIVIRNPNILKTLPCRWKGNASIGIALSSIVMLILTGCGEKTTGSNVTSTSRTTEDGKTGGRQTKTPALIAPIFEHGDGRGSFGCVSVAPPAFLSEAEAFEVVSEEVKKQGIVFEKDNLELKNVKIPVTSLMYDHEENKKANLKSQKGSLTLDGYDNNKKIAFEFISKEDVTGWQSKEGGWSSVESYDALGTAERLKEGLEGKIEENTVALFYDPMGFEEEIHKKYNEIFKKFSEDEKLTEDERNKRRSETFKQYEEELKELKTEQLREQVKDFIDWLKAQGIV